MTILIPLNVASIPNYAMVVFIYYCFIVARCKVSHLIQRSFLVSTVFLYRLFVCITVYFMYVR